MEHTQSTESLLCPLRYALSLIGGKWKLPILCILADGKPKRYGEIKKRIPEITNMMLSQSLKELENCNMVRRKQYSEIPPRVEYTLIGDMSELLQPLILLADWGTKHMEESGKGCAACASCKEKNVKDR